MNEQSSKIRIAKGARRTSPFATIEESIEAIRNGRMVIVIDDEDRENEGDLTMAASTVTPDAICCELAEKAVQIPAYGEFPGRSGPQALATIKIHVIANFISR